MTLEFGIRERHEADRLVALALMEDLGDLGDLTTQALIPGGQDSVIEIAAREEGVVAGLPVAETVLKNVDDSASWTSLCEDGSKVQSGQAVARVSGRLASLLTAERTCLNFLTHLSGVTTLTRRFVDAVSGSDCAILDTRKTIPGWRHLQKYAVRAGGGTNHRIGLFDGVLIKDNHIAGWESGSRERSLADAVLSARENTPPGIPIQVEVDSLEQLKAVLSASPDMILLDNMDCPTMAEAVSIRDELAASVQLEASGNMSLERVADVARTGVDRISIGALTHSAPSLDLGFDFMST
ncbi:MAG: nicotinate-nucleotide diphosphorylase (carboxylating) [Planctomycetaceae bacterium]|nr:nicotinate-nucleotide diphosphorylase (carboxylating) [Planctomycetaceae bacterium]